MTKIGRNSLCPCGSGKKFKRCHGSPGAQDAAKAAEIDRFIRVSMMRHEARQKEVEKQFGRGRPPIAFESNGYKVVAVGSELQWSKEWETFPDFLMYYYKKVMGAEWGQAQLAKDRQNWSPIFEWYAQTCEYQGRVLNDGKPRQVEMIGAACGVLWLTYGLYLLRHNVEIEKRLMARLRTDDPVQIFGALQEVLVASALLRAGFELKLEDEGDGSNTHVEYVATSKLTGKSFSVESRCVIRGGLKATNRVRAQCASWRERYPSRRTIQGWSGSS